MPYTLRSGLVIAGGYADKVRRVLFAQLRDEVKSGRLSNSDVAKAAAELNRLLFEILVNKLHVDKGDVVRIIVEYEVEPPNIKWKLDTLTIQVWRRVPDEEIEPLVKEAIETAEEYMKGEIQLTVEKLGETDTGDVVYRVKYGDLDVGAILVTPVDHRAVIRGAITEPTPIVLRRTIIEYEGDLDQYISENISRIISQGRNSERREAQKVVNEILALLEVEEEEPELEE
ncbi:MAG: DUF2258 domain-containing protein [Desulfurococcales archaeon]|nr:DUF2258 domain-containing protein [Desulfurococcales archaeon]